MLQYIMNNLQKMINNILDNPLLKEYINWKQWRSQDFSWGVGGRGGAGSWESGSKTLAIFE